MAKIWTTQLMAKYCEQRPGDLTIVLTNGCFDLLHRGHVETLRFAKRQGDILIVAVNTDESVRALKGPHRPIHPLADRMAVLEELSCVDYIVPFGTADNPSVEPLAALVVPDVLVKGGDYTRGTVVGGAVVEKAGGRVVIGPVVPGASTTGTVERLRIAECGMRNGGSVLPRTDQSHIQPPDGMETPESPSSQGNLIQPPQPWPRRANQPSSISHHQSPRGIMTCLVDLDGTLVDTFGAMARVLGLDLSPEVVRGCYDLDKVFKLPADWFALFGPDFWESAPWMPDGQGILQVAVDHFGADRVYLCSSPTRDSSSAMGKLRWIEHHMDERWLRRYILTPCKSLLAGPRVLLIDDCDRNVDEFRSAGGQTILVPRAWNTLWNAQEHRSVRGYIIAMVRDLKDFKDHRDE